MAWADDQIAKPMGYEHAVLFPRARDAIKAYVEVTARKVLGLPSNICPEAFKAAGDKARSQEIDQATGLAPNLAVQLYGYRNEVSAPLEIDPLMTGWVGRPCCESTIISFGFKKTLNVGCGGAFLTNNTLLAAAMMDFGFWPGGDELTALVQKELGRIHWRRDVRFEQIKRWDAALGDLLPRIPMEQVMPWRVMRRVPDWGPKDKFHDRSKRDTVVAAVRAGRIPVGTNYPPLTGSNKWGDEVINFFPEFEAPGLAADSIERALYG